MDGRCQKLVHDWVEKEFGVHHPDTITIAGADGVLVNDEAERVRAMKMAGISVDKHGAEHAAVVGHSECAGNPVSDEEHHDHIRQAVDLVKGSGLFKEVVGLYVNVGDRTVKEIARS
jgi:3',5'-cyclic AMP phosphodiesterase CpdA